MAFIADLTVQVLQDLDEMSCYVVKVQFNQKQHVGIGNLFLTQLLWATPFSIVSNHKLAAIFLQSFLFLKKFFCSWTHSVFFHSSSEPYESKREMCCHIVSANVKLHLVNLEEKYTFNQIPPPTVAVNIMGE